MPSYPQDPITNPGSNRDADMRRTGGSRNDPHGGHEDPDLDRRGPVPNPVEEMAPSGTGELPATRRSASEAADSLAYTGSQVPNLTDELAGVDGLGTLDPRQAPGFGPGEGDKPQLEGNPELGIDPNEVAPPASTEGAALDREGMYETGKSSG